MVTVQDPGTPIACLDGLHNHLTTGRQDVLLGPTSGVLGVGLPAEQLYQDNQALLAQSMVAVIITVTSTWILRCNHGH